MSQNIAWAAVGAFGPRILPGRSVGWDPPEPRARWERLLRKIRKTVGDFDQHVVYERREGRPGVLLTLIRNGAAMAFVKIRLEEEESIAVEARALELVSSTRHSSFSAPQPMTSGVVEGWSYLVTSPLPAGRHRMMTGEPLGAIFSEVSTSLSGLERSPVTPDHWQPMHGDLTPWNLRTFGRGPWLIDWETSGWGPPHADEVLYRATAAALGREVETDPPADISEAVAFWTAEIEERAGDRKSDGLPAEQIGADILDALGAITDATGETA
jgi:hypothetical protein